MIYICKTLIKPGRFWFTLPKPVHEEYNCTQDTWLLMSIIETKSFCIWFTDHIRSINDVAKTEKAGSERAVTKPLRRPSRTEIIIPHKFCEKMNWTYPRYITLEPAEPRKLIIKELFSDGTNS